MDIIIKHFPQLSAKQKQQYEEHARLFIKWNEKINCVSRKDIHNIWVNHILHALTITKFIQFKPFTHLLDVGTGGGLPGLPLAIYFPQVKFHLVDSIGKKILVVNDLVDQLKLTNVLATNTRVEKLEGHYDFILSRAVAPAAEIIKWTYNKISKDHHNDWKNGWIFWKGGNLDEELSTTGRKWKIIALQDEFQEPNFEEKFLVYSAKK